MGWVTQDELDEDEDEDESINFESSEWIKSMVSEKLTQLKTNSTDSIKENMIQCISKYHVTHKPRATKQPKIHVCCINMTVNADTFDHLTTHPRIGEHQIEGLVQQDDDMDDDCVVQ